MKRLIPVYVILITLILSACGASRGGPQTWLDRPLNESTIPLAALIIQAHASDLNGVSTFEFYVNDTFLSSVSSSGERLSEALVEWAPPELGSYTIKARAADKLGEFGPITSVHIIVVNAGDLSTQTPTPASAFPECASGDLIPPILLSPVDGASVAPDPVLSWDYPDTTCHPHSYKIDISENAAFADVSWGFGTLDYNETSRLWPLPAGQCYYWRVSAYTPDTYGPASTAWSFCIEGTPTFTPIPLIDTLTPTATATMTSTVIPDTTAPVFTNTGVSPDKILTAGTGCPSYARTVNVIAQVVDNQSAISNVWATWNVTSENGQINLTAIGGNAYQGVIGPVNTIGTLNITIFAQDTAGNTAQSSTLYVNVQNCIQ